MSTQTRQATETETENDVLADGATYDVLADCATYDGLADCATYVVLADCAPDAKNSVCDEPRITSIHCSEMEKGGRSGRAGCANF